MTHDHFQNCLKGRRWFFFFSFYLDDRRQTAWYRFRFFVECFPGSKVHCLFLAVPSVCIPTCFTWAMHAEVRSSKVATWYKWVFISPFFPAWKDLNAKDHLCFYGTRCTWLFCRITYKVHANRRVSSLRVSVQVWATTYFWHSNNITVKKWRFFFPSTYKFLIAYLFYCLNFCMHITQSAHYAIFFSIIQHKCLAVQL